MKTTQKKLLMFEEDYESMRDLKECIEDELGWNVELSANRNLLDRLSCEKFDLILVDSMIRPTSLNADGEEVQNVHFDNINWKLTGFEFIRRFQRGEFCKEKGLGTSPNIPVLVLSSVSELSIEDNFFDDLQLAGYLYKPFRLDDIIEFIDKLIED
jgi:DNA-binding NarL/FixJ family response regulator